MQIVIWGMGNLMKSFIDKKALYKNDTIIAFVDNNPLLWKKSFNNIPIIMPQELQRLNFDYIIICVADYKNIKEQIVKELKIKQSKIKILKEIENYYKKKLINKYKNSTDTEILKEISFYKKNGLSVFGSYSPKLKNYEVFRDENFYPYIIFEGKRIYYPNTYSFFRINKKEFVSDIMWEQKENSPHLYIRDKNVIQKGDVIVDAGTCEGNFVIRFIDKISKAYLIESDPLWTECLEKTFYAYKDKVVICNKQLTSYDSDKTITLDSLLKNQKIDFLKMDIEGAETEALLGAQNTLLNNHVNCSICCYHKMNDEKNIKFILNNLGYHTETSNGYMFFWYDENILDTLDLRKGIVYASNNKLKLKK